jgi:hypothetical protein
MATSPPSSPGSSSSSNVRRVRSLSDVVDTAPFAPRVNPAIPPRISEHTTRQPIAFTDPKPYTPYTHTSSGPSGSSSASGSSNVAGISNISHPPTAHIHTPISTRARAGNLSLSLPSPSDIPLPSTPHSSYSAHSPYSPPSPQTPLFNINLLPPTTLATLPEHDYNDDDDQPTHHHHHVHHHAQPDGQAPATATVIEPGPAPGTRLFGISIPRVRRYLAFFGRGRGATRRRRALVNLIWTMSIGTIMASQTFPSYGRMTT